MGLAGLGAYGVGNHDASGLAAGGSLGLGSHGVAFNGGLGPLGAGGAGLVDAGPMAAPLERGAYQHFDNPFGKYFSIRRRRDVTPLKAE